MSIWEQYAQDESIITIEHVGKEDFRLSCDGCDWYDKAMGETQANNKAMDHILEHDARLEGEEWD